jgi:hypothetical protein
LCMRLGGPRNQPECYGEEKNLFPLPGIKPWFLDYPAYSLVSIQTDLSQFQIVNIFSLVLEDRLNKFWNEECCCLGCCTV